MKFSQGSTLSAIAAIAGIFGRAQAIGDCDNGPWKVHAVGYDTGGPWCATKWKQGAAINGVQAWYNGDSINGIEFQYTNGASPERFGQQHGTKKEWLTWDTTRETVEAITVWPNGKSDVKRVAAIEIKIKDREAWRAGSPPKNTQGYDSPVVSGAGIIMGAYGNQGGSIDLIGFLMMESGIKNRSIKDFNLNGDSLNANNEAIKNAKPEAIDSFTQENWTGENMTYSVDREVRKLKTWSTTRSTSKTFGGSVGASVDFGLPAIGLGGSISTEFHWEQTNSIETSESGEKEEILQFSVAGKIPKGEAIYCESLAFTGKYDLQYGSTIDLELQSGQRWSYDETGTVKGVAWSRNENKCITYQEGESGAEVLQKKLEEWKQNPEKEEEENKEREQRAEESLSESASATAKEQPTSTTNATTPTATGKSQPTATGEPSEEDESVTATERSASTTDAATPTATDDVQPTAIGEPTEDESTEEPNEDESTEEPTEDESTEEPAEDESTGEPTEDESNEEPTEDESTEEPTEDESTEEPAEDESTGEPTEDESTEEPTEDESTEEPTEDESTEEPTEDESTEEPSEDESTGEPTEDESTEEPTEDESTEEPTEDESTEEPTEDESTEEPAEDESTEEPTEEEPTEEEPTEEEPTEEEPTEEEPTEDESTEDESTEEPTEDESTEEPTEEEPTEESTTESAVTESATMDMSAVIDLPTATEEPETTMTSALPSTSTSSADRSTKTTSSRRSTKTSGARAGEKRQIENEYGAQITPAPVAVSGKRSVPFTA